MKMKRICKKISSVYEIEMSYLWNVYLWNVLSMKCSMKCPICEMSCLWNVLSMICLSIKCPSIKCLSIKWPNTKLYCIVRIKSVLNCIRRYTRIRLPSVHYNHPWDCTGCCIQTVLWGELVDKILNYNLIIMILKLLTPFSHNHMMKQPIKRWR